MNEKVVEIEKPLKGKIKEEQEVSAKEDPSYTLFSKEKEDPDKIKEMEGIWANGKVKKKKHEFHLRFKRHVIRVRVLKPTNFIYTPIFYLNFLLLKFFFMELPIVPCFLFRFMPQFRTQGFAFFLLSMFNCKWMVMFVCQKLINSDFLHAINN